MAIKKSSSHFLYEIISRRDLVNITHALHVSPLWVRDLEQIQETIYEICLKETTGGSEEAVCDPLTVFPSEYFLRILCAPPTPHTSPSRPVPMLYQDLWCMHALGLVWEEGKKGERDDRGIGRGVKGRGVSWLFVLHCSHPCDQSREETFRALLQERHVVWFFKGEYNLKINLCALLQGWTHKTGLVKW